jgi:hypothetical protein
MLKLIGRYPFIKIYRVQTPPNFDTVFVNNDELSLEQKGTIRLAKELLTLHRLPLNKIRFVFNKTFTYDVDTNTVNPKYVMLQPRKKRNHPIEIGKPENLMSISVGLYQIDHDNYATVREIIKKSKRGVVIMLPSQKDLSGLDYSFLMANLDNAVEFHKNNK